MSKMLTFVALLLSATGLIDQTYGRPGSITATAASQTACARPGGAQMREYWFSQAAGQPHSKRSKRVHAETKITVRNSEAKPFDQAEEPALLDIRLDETFTGDIEGESMVRAVEVRRGDQSANLVSMQRVRGKLAGRQGTFMLQGSEIVENGKIKATWFVVPGSGMGGLAGLRGEGGFEGEFGKGSDGTLDYWFE